MVTTDAMRTGDIFSAVAAAEEANRQKRAREREDKSASFRVTQSANSAGAAIAGARAILDKLGPDAELDTTAAASIEALLEKAKAEEQKHDDGLAALAELQRADKRLTRKRKRAPTSVKFMDGTIALLSKVKLFKIEKLKPFFKKLGLVFEQHGQNAEKDIRDAQQLLKQGEAEGVLSVESVHKIRELAASAHANADAYDKLRGMLLELGLANFFTPLVTLVLEPYYRYLERKGERRWDDAGNFIGAMKEFPIYEFVNLAGYRGLVMGWKADFNPFDRDVRKGVMGELQGAVVETGGNLGLSWLIGRFTGCGIRARRIISAPIIGALAGWWSWRKVSPEVRGFSEGFFAALGAVNGLIRFALAQVLIPLFFGEEKKKQPAALNPGNVLSFPYFSSAKATQAAATGAYWALPDFNFAAAA